MTRSRYYLPSCACVLDQDYDPKDYAGTMVWTAIVRRCKDHPGLSDADLPAVAYGDMLRASHFQNKVAEAGGSVVWPNDSMADAYTGSDTLRVLTATVEGLNVIQQAAVQDWANTTFGLGKVIVLAPTTG